MDENLIVIEVKVTAANIKELVIDFLIKQGVMKDRNCVFKWTYDYVVAGEFTGAAIMRQAVVDKSLQPKTV